MSQETSTLLPWYLGYQGGDSLDAIQCMSAGDNGYEDNQAALNNGLNNHWARNNTPWSWGYLKRDDIPVHFAIAEGWTSGDMYQVRRSKTLSMLFVDHFTNARPLFPGRANHVYLPQSRYFG